MEIIQRSNLLNPTPPSIDDHYNIPDWLLFEILLRLPLNSVFRCRIVSKRWLSVASDRCFIRDFASRASSSLSRPPWIVLLQSVGWYHKIMVKFVGNPSKNRYFIPRTLYLRPQPHQRDLFKEVFSIIGLSDGLVLYSCSTIEEDCSFHRDFYVCNPITGHRTEPVPFRVCDDGVRLGWGFLTRVDQEFTLKSYRIVQAMQNPDDPTAITFNDYKSEMGDWRTFTAGGPGPNQLDLQKSAAVLDGVMYWADCMGDYVIAYDPEAEPEQRVRLIRDPYDEEKPQPYERYDFSCVACRGELRYFGRSPSIGDGIPGFNIWKLSSGEWCVVHKVERTCIVRALGVHNMLLQIACFDPFDSDVVYLLSDHRRSAFSYSLENGTLDDYREMIVSIGGSFTNGVCLFPKANVLVVSPWPIDIAEKHLERRIG